MTDGIERSGDKATFASYLTPGWHRFGTTVDHPVDTQEMLRIAHMHGWGIHQVPMPELEYNGRKISGHAIDKKFLNVRTHPFSGEPDVIGVVGNIYQIVQNEELFEFAQGILDGGGVWETAGSIKGGTVVFGTLTLPREITVDPNGSADKITSYLLMHSAHDGTAAVSFRTTNVRVVCQNTLTMALKDKANVFTVKHTKSLEGKIAAAREALNMSYEYDDAFEAELQTLFAADLNVDQFNKIIADSYPELETEKGQTRRQNVLDTFTDLFTANGDVPDTVSNLPLNAYRGVSAVTAYFDHHRSTRGDGEGRDLARMGLVDEPKRAELIGRLREFAIA